MDWLQFIASIAASFAWPAVILFIAIKFGPAIKKLIDGLRSFKLGEWQAEFEQKLNEAEAVAPEIAVQNPSKTEPPEDADKFDVILNASPNLAILHQWIAVENKLYNLADQVGLSYRKGSISDPLSKLLARRIINPNVHKLANELRHLRNLAAHPDDARPVSVEDASRYRTLSQELLNSLDAAGLAARSLVQP